MCRLPVSTHTCCSPQRASAYTAARHAQCISRLSAQRHQTTWQRGAQAAVAGLEEEQLSQLLGEDPSVAQQRKQVQARVSMLRKAVHEISSFTG
jgi:Dynamin GTPase effector domain